MSVSFFLLLLFSFRSCVIFLVDFFGVLLVYWDLDVVGGVFIIWKWLFFEVEVVKGGGGGELEWILLCEIKKLVLVLDGFKYGCGNWFFFFDFVEVF